MFNVTHFLGLPSCSVESGSGRSCLLYVSALRREAIFRQVASLTLLGQVRRPAYRLTSRLCPSGVSTRAEYRTWAFGGKWNFVQSSTMILTVLCDL